MRKRGLPGFCFSVHVVAPFPMKKPVIRGTFRPRFAFRYSDESISRAVIGCASEWRLFDELRAAARHGWQLAWFECCECPLTPRALAGLNCYIRTRAILKWRSKRWQGPIELIGWPEWRSFVKMLGLTFDGRETREMAA